MDFLNYCYLLKDWLIWKEEEEKEEEEVVVVRVVAGEDVRTMAAEMSVCLLTKKKNFGTLSLYLYLNEAEASSSLFSSSLTWECVCFEMFLLVIKKSRQII